MASEARTNSEGELVQGLRRSDREALAAVYDQHAGIAYGLALRMVGSQAEAEDVVQDSFIALWRQAERIDPARGVRSYLLTIVHNKSVDRLRRLGRRAEVPLDLDAPIAAEDDVERRAEKLGGRARVRAALGSLPEEQRQALRLTYFNGMTIDAAAKQLQAPVGTIKSRLRLALGHLRRELGEA